MKVQVRQMGARLKNTDFSRYLKLTVARRTWGELCRMN